MNHQIVDYYLLSKTDNRGRTLKYTLAQNDLWWEATHNFIQWVFPDTEPSQFNLQAPLLDADTIKKFQANGIMQNNLMRASLRFLRFLELDSLDPWWVMVGSTHNCLRISRLLRCTTMCLSTPEIPELTLTLLERLASRHSILMRSYDEFWRPTRELRKDIFNG